MGNIKPSKFTIVAGVTFAVLVVASLATSIVAEATGAEYRLPAVILGGLALPTILACVVSLMVDAARGDHPKGLQESNRR